MKKFRLAVLAAVVCTAALLTSCIKEESYEVSTAYLDVTFNTRSESSSIQQGDGITDVMLWAFKCSIDPTTKLPYSVIPEASGWRTVTGLNVYQSIGPIHLPLPLCDNGSQNYVIVAVINKGQFGRIIDRTAAQETVDGVTRYPTLALNANTTYNQLINASFDASQQEWWQKYVYDDVTTKTPTHMPVSHWATVSVNNEHTHDSKCAHVVMNVFRAVAKAQLFMTKASDFELEVVEAKLTNHKMHTEGILLSELLASTLSEDELEGQPTPQWFGDDPAIIPSDWEKIRPLMNGSGIINETNNTVTVSNLKTSGYQFVGSTFMYESTGVCQQTDTSYGEGSVTVDTGYYLEVGYKINGGEEILKYVAIPYAVVRNHDYQIKATVQADGQISVSYTVADWLDKTWNLAFDAPINTNIMTAPSDNADAPGGAPTMRYTNGTEEGAFVGYFKMTGPEGLTWQPTLTKGVRFSIAVYEVINANGTPSLAAEKSQTPIAADAKKWYAIKVIPLEPMDITNTANNEVSLGITYAPKWDEGATDFLFINQGSGDDTPYYWAGNQSSTFLLKITQNDQTN